MMASTLSFSTSSPARPLSVNLSRKLLCLRAGAATFASAYSYRSLGGGPIFHKFGKWVRYAVDDLDAWADMKKAGVHRIQSTDIAAA